MSIKILTKTGEEVTHIDDARAYNFDAGNMSGIVKGAFNEGRFFSASNNVIALDTCELRIAGHRIVIDSAESITLTNTPASNTRYSMIAEIVVNDSSTPSFRLFIQPSTTSLTKDNLYKTTKGNGTYQLEIGRFTLTPSGLIEDVVRTADVISGGTSGGDNTYIEIGTVTTNIISQGSQASVDIENVVDEPTGKKKTNFNFDIPATTGTTVSVNGEEKENISFKADPQTQITEIRENVSNPNLLINGDFSINTNGHTSYNENNSTYILNNWKSTSAIKVEKIETGIRLSTESATRWYSMLTQNLDLLNIEQLVGKTLTLSAQIRNYTGSITDGETLRLVFFSDDYTTQISNVNVMLKTGLISVSGVVPVGTKTIAVEIFRRETALIEIELDYIKLEIGSIATAFSPNVVENYFIDNIPSNPNFLINGDFRVNQRGLTTYSSGSNKYCVDRWLINANTSASVVDNGILVTSNANGTLNQYVELPYETLAGKYVTISINISGVVYGATALVPSTKPTSTLNIINKQMNVNGGTSYFKLDYDTSKNCFRVYYYMNTATTYEIRYIKFEIGSIATPNTPRPYAEELALCQRYFIKYKVSSNYGSLFDGITASSLTQFRLWFELPTSMRISPTVKRVGNMQVVGSAGSVDITGMNSAILTQNRLLMLLSTTNNLSAWTNYYLQADNDATASFEIDAEIY